jgi:hypothetical protein
MHAKRYEITTIAQLQIQAGNFIGGPWRIYLEHREPLRRRLVDDANPQASEASLFHLRRFPASSGPRFHGRLRIRSVGPSCTQPRGAVEAGFRFEGSATPHRTSGLLPARVRLYPSEFTSIGSIATAACEFFPLMRLSYEFGSKSALVAEEAKTCGSYRFP